VDISRHQNAAQKGFLIDILSDESGASIHRLQTVLFNLIFGIWFVFKVLHNIADSTMNVNLIIPIIEGNNLIFLGISTSAYIALKSTENKVQIPANSLSGANVDTTAKP